MEFQLFRIKVLPLQQIDWTVEKKDRREILKEAINALPNEEKKDEEKDTRLFWHVGNVKPIDVNSLYFRIGRTTKSTMSYYQEGKFQDKELDTAPYTHAVLDINLEVIAIAKNQILASEIYGIAKSLMKLLNKGSISVKYNVFFEVDKLIDPDNFISLLTKAYSISKFWVKFSRPNPFDANEDFYKPMEKFVEESQAEIGRTEIKGKALNANNLEDVARSASATGNAAGATMKFSQKGKFQNKQLTDNPVTINGELDDSGETLMDILDKVRNRYQAVRGDK